MHHVEIIYEAQVSVYEYQEHPSIILTNAATYKKTNTATIYPGHEYAGICKSHPRYNMIL